MRSRLFAALAGVGVLALLVARNSGAVAGAVAPAHQPDAMIRIASKTFKGSNVYNHTGVHQRVRTNMAWGAAIVFQIEVQNDGTTPDAFRVRGPGSRHHLRARYRDAAGHRITHAVVAGTYRTATLGPGRATRIRLKVALSASTPMARRAVWRIVAKSVADPLRRDAVKAVVTPNVYAEDAPGNFSSAVAGVPARVYVPDNTLENVTEINAHTFQIVRRVPVGQEPQHVTPGWDLRHLYCDNSESNSLTVIDPRTGKRVKTLRGISDPYNLYFTPNGRKALNVNEDHGRLEFRDPHTWRLMGVTLVPWAGLDHGDFTPNGRFIVMSTEVAGVVLKVDTRTMRIVGHVATGGSGVDVKVSPDGRRFYVANQGSGGVHVIDPVRMRVTQFIRTGRGAHGLAVSRDTRRLYVANRLEGSISVIRFATNRVVAKWRVGGTPDMLQVSPDGKQLWASNRYNGSVSVINTASGRVIRVIHTGIKPHGLAYFPQPGRYSVGHNGVFR